MAIPSAPRRCRGPRIRSSRGLTRSGTMARMARGGYCPCPPQEVPMRIAFPSMVAIAGGLLIGPTAKASDTMLLAGVGSMSGERDLNAPAITLQRTDATTADTVEVYAPIARGV